MKKIWTSRKNEEAVSPVIATILLVAITVVLTAVLYMMVLGIGNVSTDTTIVTMSKSSTASQYIYTVYSVSSKNPVPLTDVIVIIKDNNSLPILSGAISTLPATATPASFGVAFHDSGTAAGGTRYLTADDSFTLNRGAMGVGNSGYGIGSSITLTSLDGTTTYASYTI
jgi:archaeal type IV pilus assembly protein PilA